jgi:phosphatidate cytidylyltransferase
VVDSNPVSHSNETDKPLSANNLVLRIASAAVLAPLALMTAYSGGWPFVLFWGAAALAVLWEWMELVAGKAHRPLFISCAGAIAAAGFLVWLERPLSALLILGLGAMAGEFLVSC